MQGGSEQKLWYWRRRQICVRNTDKKEIQDRNADINKEDRSTGVDAGWIRTEALRTEEEEKFVWEIQIEKEYKIEMLI